MQEVYRTLRQHVSEYAVLESISSVLAWDERTMLPPAAASFRGEQMKALARLVHERRTDERLGELLSQLEQSPLAADPLSETGATIRALRRDYDRARKLPRSLVEALAEATVMGQQIWQRRVTTTPSWNLLPSWNKFCGWSARRPMPWGTATIGTIRFWTNTSPARRPNKCPICWVTWRAS